MRAEYSARDKLFSPPVSTFEATKCESNKSSINTVPGKQRFAFDFRVLPEYSLDKILTDLREVADAVEARTGAKILLDTEQRADPAPRTSESSEIVRRLSRAIASVKSVEPKPVGIGISVTVVFSPLTSMALATILSCEILETTCS